MKVTAHHHTLWGMITRDGVLSLSQRLKTISLSIETWDKRLSRNLGHKTSTDTWNPIRPSKEIWNMDIRPIIETQKTLLDLVQQPGKHFQTYT